MSKKQEMKKFIKDHEGETFTATALACAIGWTWHVERERKNLTTGDFEKLTLTRCNARRARSIARKCGAWVAHHPRPNSWGYWVQL